MDPCCCPWVLEGGRPGSQEVSEMTDATTPTSLGPQNREGKPRVCNLYTHLPYLALAHFLTFIFGFFLSFFSPANLPTHSFLPTHKGVLSSSFSYVVPIDVLFFLLYWPFKIQLVPRHLGSTFQSSSPAVDAPSVGPYSTGSYTSTISHDTYHMAWSLSF